jgi:hypothetical protein
MEIEANFSGEYDFNDLQKSQFSLLIEIIAALNNSNDENLNAEIIILDNNIYFAVHDLSDFEGQLPIAMFESLLSKWWFMPIPEENLTALELYTNAEDPELTAEEQKVEDLLSDSFMFKNVEYRGGEKVEGEKAYYYTAELDKAAVKDSILESAEIMGEFVLDADLEQVDDFLKSVEAKVGLWISQEEKTLIKVSLEGNISEPGIMSVDLEGSYTLSEINEDVKLEAPEGAEMFDLLPLLMGASALIPEDELYGDDFTFDESAYDTDFIFDESAYDTDFIFDESIYGDEIIFEEYSEEDFADLSY